MLANKVFFERQINGRVYQFLFDVGSPKGEMYDVLGEMQTYVVNNIVEDQQKCKNEQEQVKDGDQQ